MAPLRIRHIPLLTAALCFAAGIATPKLTAPVTRPALFLLAATLSLATFVLLSLRRSPRMVLLPLCALWFTAGIWCAQIEPAAPAQTELLSYADGLSRTMQAHVIRIRELPPRNTNDADRDFDAEELELAGEHTYSVDLSVTQIENVTPDISQMLSVAGGIRATLTPPAHTLAPVLHCGDTIEAPVRLHQPQRFRDPGVFQYADYMLTQSADGIAATTLISATKLHVIAGPPLDLRGRMRCRIAGMQTWASHRLLGYLTSAANRSLPLSLQLKADDAATLAAMLFGDRTRLTHQLRLGFERTGSFHLFVVSGMHVGLLAGALLWLGERLRLPRWAVSLVTLLIVSFYAVLTGFGIPVQRALLMTAAFLFARLLFRERIAFNALGAAALIVLVASPRALFETSFQMTFLALVAIAGIATPLAQHRLVPWSYAAGGLDLRWKDASLPPRLAQLRVMLSLWQQGFADLLGPRAAPIPSHAFRALLWFTELALIGIVAEAVMVLPMALYFHRATVFSLPANMVSVPLVALIAGLGLATFVCSLATPWLALLPASLTAMLLHVLTSAIHTIAATRAADVRVPGPPLWRSLAALLCVALCPWFARRARKWVLAPAGLLLAAALLVLWPHTPPPPPHTLEVTAIDVGQGDSLLIVDPSGSTMLVDSGGPTGGAAHAENASGASAFDVGEEVVSPYLWSRQIRSLDVLVLSHAHSDHMGGMPAVVRNFHPRELWVGIDPSSADYRDLLAEAGLYGTTVRHLRSPDTLTWHNTSIAVLAPSLTYTNFGPPKNNDSLVLHLQYGKASVLLEGDAEAPSERAMVEAGSSNAALSLGPVTLLKVGHHGSRTSTTPDLLAAAAPQDAVISVGRGNTFGHPRPEILERLAQAHVQVFRTDQFGMTTFRLSPDGKISATTSASNP